MKTCSTQLKWHDQECYLLSDLGCHKVFKQAMIWQIKLLKIDDQFLNPLRHNISLQFYNTELITSLQGTQQCEDVSGQQDSTEERPMGVLYKGIVTNNSSQQLLLIAFKQL